MLNDRLAAYAAVAADLGVDAVALVPGPNFTRIIGQAFMSLERPFVVAIPANGQPAALLPNLEIGSWDQVGFGGRICDWRAQSGYDDAFANLTKHLGIQSLVVEGQVMRILTHHVFLKAKPDLEIIDGEREISSLRMVKAGAAIAAPVHSIRGAELTCRSTRAAQPRVFIHFSRSQRG
jgi:Xaa-Pro aminopeptidase